jgi:hypothetical protein
LLANTPILLAPALSVKIVASFNANALYFRFMPNIAADALLFMFKIFLMLKKDGIL